MPLCSTSELSGWPTSSPVAVFWKCQILLLSQQVAWFYFWSFCSPLWPQAKALVRTNSSFFWPCIMVGNFPYSTLIQILNLALISQFAGRASVRPAPRELDYWLPLLWFGAWPRSLVASALFTVVHLSSISVHGDICYDFQPNSVFWISFYI